MKFLLNKITVLHLKLLNFALIRLYKICHFVTDLKKKKNYNSLI